MGEGSQQQLLDTEGEHDIFPSVSGPDITIVDYGLACARGLLEFLAYGSRSALLKAGSHCEPSRCVMAQ